MKQAELLERVKQAVHEVEPEADIVLWLPGTRRCACRV